MNIRKLRKLEKWILEEPKRFDMKEWSGSKWLISKRNPPCGTVGCLAGMACHMEGHKLTPHSGWLDTGSIFVKKLIDEEAAKILGLTDEQEIKLFYMPKMHSLDEGWPKKFETAYYKAKTLKAKAQVAVERIEHFIKTKGRE